MESTTVSGQELEALRVEIERNQADYFADLKRLVAIDCGSYTKAGVDEGSLATFPTAFQNGMPKRAHVLNDVGPELSQEGLDRIFTEDGDIPASSAMWYGRSRGTSTKLIRRPVASR